MKLIEAKRDKKKKCWSSIGQDREASRGSAQAASPEDDLSTTRNQIKILTKKLEEAEKAKE